MGPLSGIRVLDFSEYLAGPLCTMLLAQMGAEVIKVEPLRGDSWRNLRPIAPGESRVFVAVNSGKKSLSVDITRPEGLEIVRQLAGSSDVVVLNFRAGVADRLGLGYEALSESNPGLIYCENNAFGGLGPNATQGGFDFIIQAMAGLMTPQFGLPGDTLPRQLPHNPSDVVASLLTLSAVCAALYARQTSGRGQRINTSLLAGALTLQASSFMSIETIDGPAREGWLNILRAARDDGASFEDVERLRLDAWGDSRVGRPEPYRGVFRTKDSLIAFSCVNSRLRARFAKILGIHDPRLSPNTDDARGDAALDADLAGQVAEGLTTQTTAEWLEQFSEAGIPAGPVQFAEELFDDPDVVANGYVAEHDYPPLGRVKVLGPPFQMSGTPATSVSPPPVLGQHTDEVLRGLGYDLERIRDLREQGVVK